MLQVLHKLKSGIDSSCQVFYKLMSNVILAHINNIIN